MGELEQGMNDKEVEQMRLIIWEAREKIRLNGINVFRRGDCFSDFWAIKITFVVGYYSAPTHYYEKICVTEQSVKEFLDDPKGTTKKIY